MIDTLLENHTSVIARDLKLNFNRLLDQGALSREEALLATLAVAASLNYKELARLTQAQLLEAGLTEEQVQEAAQSAAMMGMLNTYYRFRHFLGNPDEYRVAGLRMTALAKPSLGKERWEMLAFAISVINGCESCTRSHEKSLRDNGVSPEKVHDLAKLAAVIKGLQVLNGG
ncbi:MAG TPA: carboxymuconolactone decarboxylase family protein [Terriglobia bacterium]|nr:carboxymuconolactone decarboxylase family protein [Terriglobia bacterium]